MMEENNTRYKLQVASYRLQVTSYKLKIRYELRVTGYGFQKVTSYKLQVTCSNVLQHIL